MKQSAYLPDPWAFFDWIGCITLRERPDRKEAAARAFAAVGLLGRVEFVLVDRHPHDRAEGIFDSHLICLRTALAAEAERILIFEDDVFFQGLDRHSLHKACAWLDAETDWNAFFLGCITNGSRKTACRHLTKITYRCLSHAYAVSRPFALQLVREEWRGLPYDMLLQHYNTAFYALRPQCAFQGLAGTDNQTAGIDRLRRLLGGLPFIQRMNELYQTRKLLLLFLHAVTLAAVLRLIFLFW